MTDNVTIVTNNQPRAVLYWHELTPRERSEFDYLENDDAQSAASFARYRGAVYDLGEFMRIDGGPLAAWLGYAGDTFFSGVVVRLDSSGDSVTFGRYYS